MQACLVNKSWLLKCYLFARQMIDNTNSDLVMRRVPKEIYLNTFEGKVGEVGVYLYIRKHFPTISCSEPDFTISPRSIWDAGDLIINNVKVDVKSINEKSGFFMIETKRFLENGEYSYKNNDGKDVDIEAYIVAKVIGNPIPYRDIPSIEPEEYFKDKPYTVKILGGISRDQFWKQKHFLPKGTKCNRINLKAACEGRPLETVGYNADNKHNAVQTDNYVLDAYRELMDMTKVLNIE